MGKSVTLSDDTYAIIVQEMGEQMAAERKLVSAGDVIAREVNMARSLRVLLSRLVMFHPEVKPLLAEAAAAEKEQGPPIAKSTTENE